MRDAGAPPPAVDAGTQVCLPPRTMESDPARLQVMSAQVQTEQTEFVRDLFTKFQGACGECHVNGSFGGFHVSESTFPTDITQAVLDAIGSNDPTKVMPPGSTPANQRPKTDSNLQLLALLEIWFKQGKPADVFVLPNDSDAGAGGGAGKEYLLSETVGNALTNLGNCIPGRTLFGAEVDDKDAFFEKAAALPQTLQETDLISFDSAVLARHGVVAYAPTYPLWSDNARKIRYVRVPRGKSITFDKTTQQFVIPDNTRFYKTFMKEVVEKDGSVRYQKMETRLIVARAPNLNPDGSVKTDAVYGQTALFGTYYWSDDEKTATLVTNLLHDQQPFTDTFRTYHTDERKYDAVTASLGKDGGPTDLTTGLRQSGAIRNYAIPGSPRCIQCHMGSPSQSFVLGFTPLQVVRRPLNVGGVIEPPGPDDLTQFARLVDLGIITGMSDTSDILPLEKSEGTRAPRNDYELKAQGYMVGNCAHCHNPRGYPSVQNPVLQNFLSFLPGPLDWQGIFQFPLEKFSPRIPRDIGGSVPMPYITPSLVDYPSQGDLNHKVIDPSYLSNADVPYLADGLVLAPWRSLIYRNVDTPFAYADDLAIFPHMPMNAPGFDCRLPQIMGDWMVSIPAARKHPTIPERLVQAPDPYANGEASDPSLIGLHANDGTDTEPQPYVEVKTGDDAYTTAISTANARLDAYHNGGFNGLSPSGTDLGRYNYCPDTSDIVDPDVTGADQAHLIPNDLAWYKYKNQTLFVPVDYQPPQAGIPYTDTNQLLPQSATLTWPGEGVPDRPHWVLTDTTDYLGPWTPRRSDWQNVLVKHQYTGSDSAANEDLVVEFLNPSDTSKPGVTLSPAVRAYALNDFPYGLWEQKTSCASKLSKMPTVQSFTGASRPLWMDVAIANPQKDADGGTPPVTTAPVYEELPGAAVFNMVCINCHGPLADSHGRMADTLQLMTGGTARVADLRDGFFGPTSAPGSDRSAVFSIGGTDITGVALTDDDWGARYMAWMALGGTQKLIPKAILDVVASTPVFGIARKLPGVDSANMLGPIETLCAALLSKDAWSTSQTSNQMTAIPFSPPEQSWGNWWWNSVMQGQQGRLMTQNGDAELLARICSLDNTMPIATIKVRNQNAGLPDKPFKADTFLMLYVPASSYPSGAPVGNGRGGADDSLNTDNLMPWCVDPPDADDQATAGYITGFQTTDGKPLPLCPPQVSSQALSGPMTYDALEAWAYRGAINAGLSVFLYLDKVSRGYTPIPPYNQCESLP